MDARFPRRGSPCGVGAFSLTYDRFHDMRGIPGIIASATADDVVADWGWQQDTSASMTVNGTTYTGSTSICFYANTPNGSQWKARGVVWARAATRTNRLPKTGLTSQLSIADTMTHPVMWIANVPPELDSHIRSPKLEGGLGTVAFSSRLYDGSADYPVKLKIQVAYVDSDPAASDWVDIEEYVIEENPASYDFTNVVNDVRAKYVRIFRSQQYMGAAVFARGWIGVDNICLTPPFVNVAAPGNALVMPDNTFVIK